MSAYRLLAVDIDGTLVDDRKELPEANRIAIQRAVDAGVRLAIASGRMIPRIEAVAERLGIDPIIIAYNGGKVVAPRSEGRELIAHSPLPADVAEFFIDYTKKSGHLLNFYHEDLLYSEDGGDRPRFRDIYSTRTGAEYHLVADLRQFDGIAPTKLILLADQPERDRLHDQFRAELGDRAFITKSDPEYLEIMAPGVNKGSSLHAHGRTLRYERIGGGGGWRRNERLRSHQGGWPRSGRREWRSGAEVDRGRAHRADE